MIRLCDATLAYQDRGREIRACDSVDLEVRPGEFLGILGPSGSGKSSLLYLLSGLKLPTTGEAQCEGKSLASLSDRDRASLRLRTFGFVFQLPYLLGYASAHENVRLAHGERADLERASELLDSLGLGERMHRLPHELSGGERQRVCVARALYNRPKYVLADEPTASLDHVNGGQVIDMLARNRGEGALVVVTHDPSMLDGADRVVRMADGRLCPEP